MSGATLSSVIDAAAAKLQAAGISSARLDSRLLVAHALGLEQAQIIAAPERAVTAPERRRIARLVARRACREPVSRILGRREFWSLSFRLTPATLDPRPDSETLVEAVLAQLPSRDTTSKILDLGTGTGCLLLALLSELPNARGLGVDSSDAALRIARANARELGLAGRTRFAHGDWAAGLDQRFDIVISNPPYIASSEMAELEPELAFEPQNALAAGVDGLDCYRRIVRDLARLLVPHGLAALEIGASQAIPVAALLGRAGLAVAPPVKDLGGRNRVLLARKEN